MTTAWRGSNRRARLPVDWAALTRRVLDRDGHACACRGCRACRARTRCARPARQVDHVIAGDNHHPSNLQAICDACHWHKSGREGGTASALARAARGLTRARRPERHPGLT